MYVAHTGGTYAVFLDFCSLLQKGPAGEERTSTEAALFSRALSGLSSWYAHPKTMVLKVTALPPGYPDGFTFPEGVTANQAAYYDRGWCFCESSLCNLTKDFDYVLDLALLPEDAVDVRQMAKACRAGRDVPLLPTTFCSRLESKSFTSKKADLEVVGGIYRAGFDTRMASVAQLSYTGLGWGDDELGTLVELLGSGSVSSLEELFLNMNRLTDVGIGTLATALGEGVARGAALLPKLRTLSLSSNQIGDAGAKALADVIARGALASLRELRLEENQLSVEKQEEIHQLLASRHADGGDATTTTTTGQEDQAVQTAYVQGLEALNEIRKNDVQEVKGYPKPPAVVELVLGAVCMLLGEKDDWNSAKRLMFAPDFLQRMMAYDMARVTPTMLAALEAKYIHDASFTLEEAAKRSRLAEKLYKWVVGVYKKAKSEQSK